MATKPWLGSIFAPTDWSEDQASTDAPGTELTLEFVHGYRAHDCRDNLHYDVSSGEIVYHAAAVGIVYNAETHEQRFFQGHTDDIVCLAVHPEGNLVATGQLGKEAYVCV